MSPHKMLDVQIQNKYLSETRLLAGCYSDISRQFGEELSVNGNKTGSESGDRLLSYWVLKQSWCGGILSNISLSYLISRRNIYGERKANNDQTKLHFVQHFVTNPCQPVSSSQI